ncbi:MAG TPA: ATP-binding protein [Noviherbaspirillum sp.]
MTTENASAPNGGKLAASEIAKFTMYTEIFGNRERAELAMHHPLLNETEVLQTRPIRDLFKTVKLHVMLHETGCCFSAPSGSGKSTALEMLVALLHMQLPGLPVYMHLTLNHQIPSIRAFFKHFLVTVNHPERKGETSDIRQRVVDCIVDDARISGFDMAVLIIDEAQAMSFQDFKFLKDIGNQLRDKHVSLIPVLMGQHPEMEEVREGLKRNRGLHLIARFCMHITPFSSFDREDDLVEIMRGIDHTCYPTGSEISWTAFFLPLAWQHGFRIENEAHNFMLAILDAAPSGAKGTFCFPARQTFFAIRRFLLSVSRLDGPDFRVPPDAWQVAVFDAGLDEAMRLIHSERPESNPNVET